MYLLRSLKGFHCLFSLLCIFAAGPLLAGETRLEGAGVSVWIPEGWTVREESGRSSIADPEEKVFLLITPLGDSGVDPLSDYQSVIDHMIAQASWKTAPHRTLIHGQSAFSVDGEGQTGDGEEVEFSLVMLRAADGRTVLALGVAREGAMPQFRQTLMRIVRSIRPAPAAPQSPAQPEQAPPGNGDKASEQAQV